MMKLRKKLRSNGGYALVYAVVAMTLMLAVVAGLTLTSVRGLRTQQAAVESLQKRYEAAGEMEEIFAKIAKCEYISDGNETEVNAVAKFKEKLKTDYHCSDVKEGENNYSCIVTISDSEGTVKATLSLTYSVTGQNNTSPSEDIYTVSVTSVSYESYSYTEATT